MNNKVFLSIDEQIMLFESRNLKFHTKEEKERFKTYLKMYGYQNFVNGYNDFFFVNEDRKKLIYKNEAKPEDMIALFNFDRSISNYLLSNIQNVERRFGTSILLAIDEWIKFKKLKNEYGHGVFLKLEKNDWLVIFEKDTSCDFKNKLREKIMTTIGSNLTSKYKKDINEMPIWAIMILLPFGTTIRFFELLNDEIQQKTLEIFGLKSWSKKTMSIFLTLLKIIKMVRNRICHNNVIFNFKTKSKKIRKTENWKFFRNIKLFDLVKILDIFNNKDGNDKTSLENIFVQTLRKYIDNDYFDTKVASLIMSWMNYKK
ncbi:Abortive infection bacteriophage resistance protein [Mycoplasmopsis californica]|uniref:Abi family protein n=1 Tax=Mycoplasmopsis equigenitalium TaxID=114883 RepID=A0ABY5J341_9BACT|nr:Abi family protein [Mycoplasmopsis equigenitalium]UUD37149.1 Abi family protein [Mycoplasmopsis equigenitalium]VEU69546.1 Abortive infection bacteriophage resistance protein [Mycoplasmopsis californica]